MRMKVRVRATVAFITEIHRDGMRLGRVGHRFRISGGSDDAPRLGVVFSGKSAGERDGEERKKELRLMHGASSESGY
jgi:hypothetical protein